MKKCNRRKNSLLTIGVVMVMSTIILSCHKMGLYQQLPGDPYIVVADAQNKNNKASKAIIKDANDKVSTAYYVEIKSTGTKSTLTPDLVVDTLLISIPPDVDPMNIKVVPQFLNTSMTAVKIVDTNKIRGFEVQDTVKLQLTNGTYHNYTLVDNEGLLITFSNGYQRKYVILAEVLSYVPPRIYDLGSYTGGLDSIGYDDANQTITIYRSPFNTDLKQILDYKFEPANAIIAPSYLPGAEFDFSAAFNQTISIPVSVPTKTGGTQVLNYKLKLHVGYRSIKQIMDGTYTISNYSSTTIKKDAEFKMAMDEDKVYILAMDYVGTAGNLLTYDLQNSSYGVYVYNIASKAGIPIKLSTDGKKIIDIIAINNTLYGIAQTATTGTISVSNTSSYQIYKWNTIEEGAPPTPISAEIIPGTYDLSFTGRQEGNNICFYGVCGSGSPTAINLNNPQVDKYTIPISSSESTPIQYTKVQNWSTITSSLALYSAGLATYVDVPGVFGIIASCDAGIALGNDFGNLGGITPKAFARVSDGGNRIPVAGGNIEVIGNKYYYLVGYLLASNSKTNALYIIDFGMNPKSFIDNIVSEKQGSNAPLALTNFYGKNIYKETLTGFGFSINNNGQKRGKSCTYRLPNGKVRMGMLVAEYGFMVWELQ